MRSVPQPRVQVYPFGRPSGSGGLDYDPPYPAVLLEDVYDLAQLLGGRHALPALPPDVPGLHAVADVARLNAFKEVLGEPYRRVEGRGVHPHRVRLEVGAPGRGPEGVLLADGAPLALPVQVVHHLEDEGQRGE